MGSTKDKIKLIVEKGEREDMETLSDMLCEAVEYIEDTNEKMYKEFESQLYEMINGRVLTEEMAEEAVHKMKPFGEHWDIATTTQVMNSKNLTYSEPDWYFTINMMYNDYYDMFKEDTDTYIKLADSWLKDVDGSKDKPYNYVKYCTDSGE